MKYPMSLHQAPHHLTRKWKERTKPSLFLSRFCFPCPKRFKCFHREAQLNATFKLGQCPVPACGTEYGMLNGGGCSVVWLPPLRSCPCPLHQVAWTRDNCPLRPPPSIATVNLCMAASPPLPDSAQYFLSLFSFCSGAWPFLPHHLQSWCSTILLLKWLFMKCFLSRCWLED